MTNENMIWQEQRSFKFDMWLIIIIVAMSLNLEPKGSIFISMEVLVTYISPRLHTFNLIIYHSYNLWNKMCI